MSKLHYYNPGHEAFVLNGDVSHTPSVNVRKLVRDLALLPAWYADPGDYVFVDEVVSPRFFSMLPKEIRPQVTQLSREELFKQAASLPKMEAAPWGISPQSIHLLNELKKEYQLNLEVPVWKEEYVRLTGRQTAAKCFADIKEVLPDLTFPDVPLFFPTLQEIRQHLTTHPGAYLLKTPYSSSGRGLLWLDNGVMNDKDRKWISGALAKQNVISMEKALNKWGDFALEFYSDGKGEITYQGISLFGTNKRGGYSGNDMISQPHAEDYLSEQIGKEKLEKIKKAATITLQKTYSYLYKGYLGIDMLIHKVNNTKEVHPCVEINMRYTMGMAAISIFNRYIHKDAQGVLKIVYESSPKTAYERHQITKKAYPLTIENGKLREGYLSLCPITKDTNFTVYIIVQ